MHRALRFLRSILPFTFTQPTFYHLTHKQPLNSQFTMLSRTFLTLFLFAVLGLVTAAPTPQVPRDLDLSKSVFDDPRFKDVVANVKAQAAKAAAEVAGNLPAQPQPEQQSIEDLLKGIQAASEAAAAAIAAAQAQANPPPSTVVTAVPLPLGTSTKVQ
ncbi:hypothetical protein FB45DRAFT_1112143 [Roridomyces roridus]|uniref:Uncharacterized protein n=1 Tax=Roridomyces roridus TaxID=1738132 RepID=A0AAD7B850_9AGAR|nr:hypothetical protein FB45DRAFT_1112143 [Roridomyces roridus]